ncbi:Ger(x)C family spore germination protein [Paenibacillus puldeungensis]|uniref:Ger(X)C family spore germination protein n=1 Tax=Paenibacillus puldeungensis TaxID=696536 RepID=A0ABW3S1H6_9BACL
MSKMKYVHIAILIAVVTCSITGCWNYREIEKMLVGVGVAIDKTEDGKIQLTAEVVDISQGKEMQIGAQLITVTGDTMFDVVRRMITKFGMKLYWSHAKAVIMSQEVAREGAAKIIDWYMRDAETRSDIHILVSGEKTAREVLAINEKGEEPISFKLEEMLKNLSSVSTSPVIQIWDFIDAVNTPGKTGFVPLVYLKQGSQGKQVASIEGGAVFKEDKMIGILGGKETKNVLFVRNEIQGGILTLGSYERPPGISLEIFKSKTEIKPVIVDGELEVQVSIRTVTAIDEVQNDQDFYLKEGYTRLEREAAEKLQNEVLSTIHMVQKQYGSDIFGIGLAIHRKMPKEWKKLEPDWEYHFKNLKATVQAQVEIRNTAMTSKPIKLKD